MQSKDKMLHLGQTLFLGGLSCLVWLVISGTGTLGQYDPPCHTNCSWTNAVGEMQMCMQVWVKNKSVCPNYFGNDGSAPPAENINVDSYVTTYTGYPTKFSRLNISFDLNLNGSGIYRGVNIEIQHFDSENNEMYCHYLNFTDELTDNDLLTEEDTVRRIFFDCSRPVRPGKEYLITIKTMPSTERPVFKYYWPPSCFYRKDDYYCQTLEGDLPSVWSPSTYIVDGTGDRHLELKFNLAPYNFDKYLVYLIEKELLNDKYGEVSNKPLYCLNIYVKNKNVKSVEYCPSQEEFQFEVSSSEEHNETIVKIIWTDVREAIYFVEMQPRPTADGEQCSTNNAVDCYIKTQDVLVKARPCERIPDPCEGEHMRCEEEDSEPACFCEKGFEKQNETCIETPPELETSVATTETLPGFGTSLAPPGKKTTVIAAVVGSLIGVLAIGLIIYLAACRNKNDSMEPENYKDHHIVEPDITTKRVFVIHSFDHELHKEVVLKLCIFLTNVCKFDVHTALWSTTDIAVGVNEWMQRECEEADKVIILCSQGTLVKWRAQSRQIDIKINEDNLGDLFSAFMRLQGLEIAKDPKKFVVAYMDYSSEEDIPQPLKFLMQKYQLMDHMEQMYYILNDMEKHSPTHDFDIPTLKSWDSSTDAGVELKMAVDQMKKKIRSEPHWFFDFNDISTDAKLKIFTKQTQKDTRPNPNISIICDADPSLVILPQTDFHTIENDFEFQMSALNSLREITSKPDDSFQNHRNHDSGVHDVFVDTNGDDPATNDGQAANGSTSIRNPFYGIFQDPNEHSCV